ncbi:MAG TPA: EAL domain-containing protein [Labilithrix sp.]|nr:EAL domain-containing protein [Labilithrix sp.]
MVRGVGPEPRILIVDDDDEARTAAAEALRSAGLVVEEVSNGLDALKAFQARRPHIVLLEVMTPFVDGYSTCRAMRDQAGGDEASIVMMTDIDDVESLRFGYEAGATDFITKPVNPVILQHRIRYMLRAAEVTDQLRKSERQIAHTAEHDALTGLPNRRSLEHYMRRFSEESPRSELGAVFLVDLDGFKRVNDTFGHSAGDELICEVGRRMTECFQLGARAPDDAQGPLLVRFGGDEFVFIEPSVGSRADALDVADRMLAAIGGSFEIRGHQLSVTASIGIALMSDVGTDIERLIQSADTAMYDAKAHDRNNARFYSHVLSDKARAHLDIENALRHPSTLDQFELFYQPKVDLRSGRVVGAEGLLRWRHPERGLISPADFIGVAEDTGLIVPIGRWVVREACRQVRAWNEVPALRGMRIAVNVSARQFRDRHFLDDVKQILSETGIDPRAIEIEITEGTLMNDTKAARALLNELKQLGIWIALDDFGTGYSSLGYLRQFPFDTLKVDRSFVSDLLTDDGCAAITSAIVAMANRLGLNVVAEGVETEGQLEYLRKLGCDQIQGYFYSRPLPVAAFERWAAGRVATEALRAPRQFASGQRLSVIPQLRAMR